MRRSFLAACTLVTLTFPLGGRMHLSAVKVQADMRIPRCQNLQLSVRMHGSRGAAGTIVNAYRLHNRSARYCGLYGYPGVQLLDRNFMTVHTVVHRGGPPFGGIPLSTVVLPPGGNAYFSLSYNAVPAGTGPCETATYLMVFAPGDFLPLVTYATSHGGAIIPCTGNINVSPVTHRVQLP